jgi:hypothetical protein
MNSNVGRNDPCPCGSGKKYKKCCIAMNAQKSTTTWADKDGLHVIAEGEKPTSSEIEEMTKEYQNQVRNSPMWDDMVNEYGREKAEELLKEFKAEVK